MAQINDGGAAFPPPNASAIYKLPENSGMSLRDWFAGQALVGLASEQGLEEIVIRAYALADAMIAQRHKAI